MRTSLAILYLSVTASACGGHTHEAPDARAADAMGTDSAAAAYNGYVVVHAEPSRPYVADAAFSAVPLGNMLEDCSMATQTIGDCCFIPASVAPPPSITLVSAGAIQLQDATSSAALASLGFTPQAGTYYDVQWSAPGWSPGDQIEASAAGDTAAGFTATASAPAPIAGISPAWDATTTLTISTAADFTVSWTPDPAASRMTLTLAAQATGGTQEDRGAILCAAPDAQGTITVDHALLSHAQPGDTCSVCGLARESVGRTHGTNDDAALWLVMHGGGGATFQ